MDNSFYLFSTSSEQIIIDKFHVCTWEFRNDTSLVEFGCEVNQSSIANLTQLNLALYVPWLTTKCKREDFYSKLKETSNSRFIFNDSITSTDNFDGGEQTNGVVHKFTTKDALCILPVELEKDKNHPVINIKVTLDNYLSKYEGKEKPNLYFRFAITPSTKFISSRKFGISKTTVIYDIKLNEKRNLPEAIQVANKCIVKQCFCFNIIPNTYNPIFLDTGSLKNMRTLEYKSFNKYLDDDRVKEDDLVVVFNKKKESESYSFFSIYSREVIGTSQIAIVVLINLFSSLLLFLPSLRNDGIDHSLVNLYPEVYFAIGLWVIAFVYFIYPKPFRGLIAYVTKT